MNQDKSLKELFKILHEINDPYEMLETFLNFSGFFIGVWAMGIPTEYRLNFKKEIFEMMNENINFYEEKIK